MTANLAGTLQGDLPWLEKQRGGHRSDLSYDGSDEGHLVYSWLARSSYSSDRPDDFEALKAAALLLVKKQHRDHVIVLPPTAEGEGVQVVDVKHMDRHAQRELMERVMGHGETDNLSLMRRMMERLQRAGLQPPTVTVRYKELSVLSRMVIADRSLPTLRKTVKQRAEPALRVLGRAPPKTLFPVIDGVSGIIRPGVFTVLLGPPGSGKTTFLRTLAGLGKRHTSLKVQAQELSYNGRRLDEFVVERSAAYVSQIDDHYGELTVRETFDLSARFQSSGYRRAIASEVAARERELGITPDPEVDAFMQATSVAGKQNLIVEVIIRLLGLDVCADTVVGSAMLRGISGGQRKRVTTGEMVVGPIRVLFADEVSTGLDSNTTYQIMRAFKNFCEVYRATMVVGLLQPQPEVFDLFQDVMLISNGKICYHGPREAVLPFFERLGFTCPPRRGVADFLQEISTPSDQHKYWAGNSKRPHRFMTVLMLEQAFKKTEQWRQIEAELAQPFDPALADPRSLATKKYGQTYSHMLRTNFRRKVILERRNKIFTIFRTSQVLLMAFVVSTVFWREDKNTEDDGNLFLGVVFYSVLFMLLSGISEMHLLVARLSVFFKQRDVHFYPGWCFAIPTFVLRIPFSFLESMLWSVLVYWIVGFSPTVRFLMFCFQLLIANIWSVAFMQLIAAVTRNDTIATACGSFFLLMFISLNGYVLNKNNIPPWWIWAYWANPYAYIFRALAINEFTSSQWMKLDPSGSPGSSLGLNVLQFRGLPNEYWWCWVAVGFCLGTMLIIVLLLIAALTFLSAPEERRFITPEALRDFQLSRRELVTPQASETKAERGEVVWPSKAAQGTGQAAGSAATLPASSKPAQAADGGSRVTVAPVPSEPMPPGTPDSRQPAEAAPQAEHPVLPTVRVPDRTGSDISVTGPLSPRSNSLLRASQRMSQASQVAEVYRQRTAIRFEPTAMTFRDVEYSVPLPPDADRARATSQLRAPTPARCACCAASAASSGPTC